MLSLPRLVILAQLGQHERLIDVVLRNGRPLPVSLRARLADEHNAPIAALSLAVQRYLELAARPTLPLRELLDQLLTTLEATTPTPADGPAHALALAALADAEQVFSQAGDLSPVGRSAMPPGNPSGEVSDLLLRLQQARASLWHALSCAQSLDPDTELPLGTVADAHTTYLILWQLNRLPEAAEHLHFPLLIDAAFSLNLATDPHIAMTLSATLAEFDLQEPISQSSNPEHRTEPVAA